MKLYVLRTLVWVQINVPVLMPIIDRILHLFGGCGGH